MTSSSQNTPHFYGRRRGRALKGFKKELLETLLPQVLFTQEEALPFFQNPQPKVLEIGFGGGEHLAVMAEEFPHWNFLGLEVFLNGVASLLQHVHNNDLKNVAIFPEDARILFPLIPKECLQEIFVLFPDPWPKKKHLERRLLTAESVQMFATWLKPGGRLTLASDDPSYLDQIKKALTGCPMLSPVFEGRQSVYERPPGWVLTHYEEKALKAERIPEYFVLEKGQTA